jgi:NUMOD3 motif
MSSKTIYRFYVYAYIRSRDSLNGKAGTPYYIGKGTGLRAYKDHGHLHLPKDTSKIVFLETNLTNVGALALERRYIKWFGRVDNNTGILHNKTDGGEGWSGLVFTETHRKKLSLASNNMSDQHRKKLSLAGKGKSKPPISEETRIKMSLTRKGKPKSNITKQKMKDSWKNRNPMSNETKIKFSNLIKIRPPLTCPYCNKVGDQMNMKRWHFDKCKFKS